MYRRGMLCCVAVLGAVALSAGNAQAATGWTAASAAGATGVTGAISSFSDTDAWAQGAALGAFAHWNGSAWTQVAGPSGGPAGLNLTAALSDDGPTDAWAVGLLLTGYVTSSPRIEHWNGSAWSISPSPAISGTAAELAGVVSLGPANAWTVGNDGHDELVEHWNGAAWSRVTVPDPTGGSGLGSSLTAVSAAPSGDIWAVGTFGNPAPQSSSFYALHYDGTAWHLVTMAQPGSQNNSNNPHASGVVAIAADDVWMVGNQQEFETPATLTEHWNGVAWSIVQSPFDQVQLTSNSEVYGALNSVTAKASNDVWAGGYYFTFTNGDPSGVYHALLIHWNGSSWTQDTSAPTTGTANRIEGISTTLGGHVIWATNAGSPSLLQHP